MPVSPRRTTASTTVLACAVGLTLTSLPIPAAAAGDHGQATSAVGQDGEATLPAIPGKRATMPGTLVGTPVASPAWSGAVRLTAGWAYRNNRAHRAWDVGLPLGTPVYAPRGGVVIGLNDGVANNRPGYNPGSNAPSNWVLICHTVQGRQVSSYWQHLSPGIRVRVGQRVFGPKTDRLGNVIPGTGTLFAHSGNTGNSTGPHLHLATFAGCAQPTGPGNNTAAAWSRYNYLNAPSTLIWEPNRLWLRPIVDIKAVKRAARTGTSSPYVAAFRRAVRDSISSPAAGPQFKLLIKRLKAAYGWRTRGGKPGRPFLTHLSNRTEDFTVR